MSNIMPPLLQDDIISHIEHAISQEDLKQPISNFEPGPLVGPNPTPENHDLNKRIYTT